MPVNSTTVTLHVLNRLRLLDTPNMPWQVPQERIPQTSATTSPVNIPDPPPAPPPGLDQKMNVLLGWGKWGVMICGFAGLLYCGGQMAIGRKNRSSFAAEGATGIPWTLGGLSLAATAAPIVQVFFK